MEYSFHVHNKLATDGLSMALFKLLQGNFDKNQSKRKGAGMRSPSFWQNSPPPVIVCIGSDLAIGDSLGPITGSMLSYKTQGVDFFLYGTLTAPVTAKEIASLRTFLKETHRGSPIIAIDAAVGEKGDVGLIKLSDKPLYPGSGANKKLGAVGNFSIMGVVAEKSMMNYGILNTTRLHLVYSMSEIISNALSSLLWNEIVDAAE